MVTAHVCRIRHNSCILSKRVEMSLTAVSSFSFLPRDAVKCMHWHRTWSVRLSLSVCPSVCNVDLSWLYKRTLGYLGK